MPFVDGEGNLGRIEYTLEHERWLRRASIRIHSSIPVSDCEVRIGPFPAHNSFVGDSQAQLEHTKGGTWIRVTGLSGTDMEYEVSLDG
jgi:hypothetical protein